MVAPVLLYKANSAGISNFNQACAVAVQAGDLIVICHSCNTANAQITGVIDPAGSIYTLGGDTANPPADYAYGIAAAGWSAGASLRVIFNATSNHNVIVFRLRGMAAASVLDVAPAPASGTGTSCSIDSGTLAQASETLIGHIGAAGGSVGAVTPGDAWSNFDQSSDGRGSVIYHETSSTANDSMAPSWATSRIFKARLLGFKTAVTGASGTLAITLDALTVAAAGMVKAQGSLSQTLAGIGGARTGAVKVQGSAARILGTLTAAATGAAKIQGATAATLGALTAAGTAAARVAGAAALELAALVIAAQGSAPTPGGVSGSLAQTLQQLVGTDSGKVIAQGQLDSALALLICVATGSLPPAGAARPVIFIAGM